MDLLSLTKSLYEWPVNIHAITRLPRGEKIKSDTLDKTPRWGSMSACLSLTRGRFSSRFTWQVNGFELSCQMSGFLVPVFNMAPQILLHLWPMQRARLSKRSF
jgi:hypothetical protein